MEEEAVNQQAAPATEAPVLIGQRNLTPEEVAAVNAITEMGYHVSLLLDQLADFPGIDMRWLAIARTDLQKGLMCAERAVTKPEKF